MRHKPINSPRDLLTLVRLYAPSRACERAIDEDRVEFLGGFLPKGNDPHWIVRIKSVHGRTWIIKVSVDQETMTYGVHQIEESDIKWSDWDGDKHTRSPLYCGSLPHVYQEKKNRSLNSDD